MLDGEEDDGEGIDGKLLEELDDEGMDGMLLDDELCCWDEV